ncbi:MAG: hypothetical protein JWP91_4064 [Fibrobacteres bacterium]|nr:hypothetical protein [Fibrobacterota bacterium]
MNSMKNVKKVFSRGVAAAVLAAAIGSVPVSAGVLCGGTVPVNNYAVGIGNTSIDVNAVHAAMTNIATFYITNNTAGGFNLSFALKHAGFAKPGQGLAATPNGNVFTGAQFALPTVPSGTYSGATTPLTTQTFGAMAANVVSPVWASGAQTVATTDWKVEVSATWAADATLLAGFYEEVVTVYLVATL